MRVSSTAPPLPLPASHCGTMDAWGKHNHVPRSHPQSRCPGQLVAPSSSSSSPSFSSTSFFLLLISSISDSTSRSLGGMEVAPAFALLLCVSLRVSLAERRHFEESNSTNADDSVDYKDPCKAGTLLIRIFFIFSSFPHLLSITPPPSSFKIWFCWGRWRPRGFWLWTKDQDWNW